ncbi:hypothetical protein O181_107528 [Austropuccinia psidii MF-1]|uniref:Tet-like 2OG-Fe(II) oxygenase domain-containing protein n=1 Tax=Austropuccinia psidii MF-1 TaxID=1389203 RepID=A0A9Q3PMY9_9BASI|nr:hypothetical protein [Austropuccinia psidii MF-1]
MTKDESIRFYGFTSKIKKNVQDWNDWAPMLARVGLHLSKQFQHETSGLFIEEQQKLLNNGLPSFSNAVHDDVTPKDFASSLTFTKNDFFNKPHKDLDASTVEVGWWIQVNKINGSINNNLTEKV